MAISEARARQLLWGSFGAGALLAVAAICTSDLKPASAPPASGQRYKVYDVDTFLETIRDTVLLGSVSEEQRQGFTYLLEGWEERYSDLPVSWLAYALATALHETSRTMQPVPEAHGKSYFFRLYDPCGPNRAGALKIGNFRCGDGERFKGRGYVQITGRDNYARFGRRMNLDLEGIPDLVVQPEIARHILFEGMIRGSFRNVKLADCLRSDRLDWVGAREIVNSAKAENKEIAEQISRDAKEICRALEASKNWRP